SDRVGIDGSREQVALSVLALELAKLNQLSQGLHAFGYDFHAHAVGQTHDSANNFGVLRGFATATNARAINLERVNREAMQITERRITGAEVVDAQLDTQGL